MKDTPPVIDTIQVQVKNTFGRELIYPVCTKAGKFAAIGGGKTITPENLEIIQALGYSVEYVAAVPQKSVRGY